MAYTKLDDGLTDSTIWQEPDPTRIVWITLLSMADQNGYIGASMPGLAGRARVSLDACITAMETFLAPDKWSRTKDHEGRRVAEAEGGWVLLNHAKYRAAQNADDRRERSRVAMAALRESRKHKLTVNTCEPALTKLTQAEAATYTETKEIVPTALVATATPRQRSCPEGLECVSEQVRRDWIAMRKAKRAAVTATAIRGIQREADRAGITLEAALAMCCARGWVGFKADWARDEPAARIATGETAWQRSQRELVERATGGLLSKPRTTVIDMEPCHASSVALD